MTLQMHENHQANGPSEDQVQDALAFAAPFLDKSEHPFAPQFSVERYTDVFTRAFKRCNDELAMQTFDTQLSGSTVVLIFFEGTRLLCANLGDSRAAKCEVKMTESDEIAFSVQELSKDHKLEDPKECERILKRGGRVESFKDTMNGDEAIGPKRVWLPDQEVPGLAMSRSMGD